MPHVSERLFAALARVCALVVAIVPVAAAATLIWSTERALVSGTGFQAMSGIAGFVPFTLGVALCSAVIGGALGAGCAIAAEELAPAAVRRAIEGAIGFLGAVPAVVFGWFAAAVLTLALANDVGYSSATFGAAVAVLAAMVAPTACALTTSALRRVPDSVRHAAAAAGASRLQTTTMIVIPSLRRRIGAAALAGFARATGEATALQILFAAVVRSYGHAPATVASGIFSLAVVTPQTVWPGQLAFPALALAGVAAICALVVDREFGGMQWV